jgi:predicted dinucleotide-binding enzyme
MAQERHDLIGRLTVNLKIRLRGFGAIRLVTEAAQQDKGLTMKIGIIGAGNVATAVAAYALAQGNEVILSNRSGPAALADIVGQLGKGAFGGSVAEAAAADIVLLAANWVSVAEILAALPPWNGRILIDATNPYVVTKPKLIAADLGGRGSSEIVAELAAGARVVKAFNSIYMYNLRAGPRHGDARRVLFISGDDAAAKSMVKDLITSFGFACADLGGLKEGGRLQQSGAPLGGPDFLLVDPREALAS